ncbi:PE-PPE domain-containing protein [Mycobacterium sp.]|uniref:PE-PPE domain-containing protein n=1 Tax=Mycobacterium sp. TaxID=1785 RepID=UPI003F97ED19
MGVSGCLRVVAAIAVAGLIADSPPLPPAAPQPVVHSTAVRLASTDAADSPLGDGTALLMGGTSIPQPSQLYLDAANTLYLQPRGFDGTLQSLFTPENASSTSEARGDQILDSTILQEYDSGDVSAQNPIVVFGYSQSASISTDVMRELAGQGVPSSDVHFVLIGDPDNPAGGSEVVTSNLYQQYLQDNVATPNDLYPTDVYTHEYDGVADFPKYPIDLLSDLNATLGFIYEHGTYLSLTSEQISDAIQLPTSTADTMVNYYIIPAESLPLLDPLRLIPIIGQPLYDLLEPDTQILVNLGYGSIDQGWTSGDADVVSTGGLFPTDINLGDLSTALGNGLQQGVSDFLTDLGNPDTYKITPLLENPSLTEVAEAGYLFGFLDSPQPTLSDALQGITEFIQAFTATT